jgi:hypothetical protein
MVNEGIGVNGEVDGGCAGDDVEMKENKVGTDDGLGDDDNQGEISDRWDQVGNEKVKRNSGWFHRRGQGNKEEPVRVRGGGTLAAGEENRTKSTPHHLRSQPPSNSPFTPSLMQPRSASSTAHVVPPKPILKPPPSPSALLQHGLDDIDSLRVQFNELFTEEEDENLLQEWEGFLVNYAKNVRTRRSTAEVLVMIMTVKAFERFPALRKLALLGLLIPATTSWVERGFSFMTVVKSERRNAMGERLLDTLMMININNDDNDKEAEQLLRKRAVCLWLAEKRRRGVRGFYDRTLFALTADVQKMEECKEEKKEGNEEEVEGGDEDEWDSGVEEAEEENDVK